MEKVFIVLDDETVKGANQREMFVSPRKEIEGDCFCIFVTSQCLLKLQQKNYYIAALWHGHFFRQLMDRQCSQLLDILLWLYMVE
jgi:hypothetical protein